MLRSILIGLDASASGSAAVEVGIQWAKRCDAVLVGLGIVDESVVSQRQPVLVGSGYHGSHDESWLLTDTRRRVQGFRDQFVRRCIAEGVKYRAIEAVGAPAERIVQESRLCDLVMLGQQPRFRFDMPYWPDQTLREVLWQTSRPVVAVPEELPDGRCLIVAYDGSPQADRALQAFRALRLTGDDDVHVLSIQANRAHAERLARVAVDFLRLHGVRACPLAVQSTKSADRVILEQVQEMRPRLLVMGAHGRPMWRQFIFSSTTSRVLEANPIPVLFCR